ARCGRPPRRLAARAWPWFVHAPRENPELWIPRRTAPRAVAQPAKILPAARSMRPLQLDAACRTRARPPPPLLRRRFPPARSDWRSPACARKLPWKEPRVLAGWLRRAKVRPPANDG